MKTGRLAAANSVGTEAYPDDGMTLDWTQYFGGAGALIPYLMVGGSGMSSKCGTFQLHSSGTTVVTGVGFQPDCVLVLYVAHFTAFANNNASHVLGIGAASDPSEQASAATWFTYLVGGNPVRKYLDSNAFISSITNTGIQWTGTLTSFDSDGFTLTNTGGTNQLVVYLALKDTNGTFKVGTETMKTSTGTKATALPADPNGLFVFGGGVTALDSVEADYSTMLGVAGYDDVGDVEQHTVQTVEIANSTDTRTRIVSGECVQHINSSGGWSAKSAASVAFGDDEFILDYTAAEGTARYFGYLAFMGDEEWQGKLGKAVIFLLHGMVTSEGIHNIDGRSGHGFMSDVVGDDGAGGTFGERDFANAGSYYNFWAKAGGFPGSSFPTQEWELEVMTTLPGGFTPFIYKYELLPV